MSAMPFASTIHEAADALEANELYQRNGWTDGLPIVPPTEDAVARFLAAANLNAADVIGIEPVRRRTLTAEKVAIAAVMAGCLQEYMPVVTAIVRAMCEPSFNLRGVVTTTHSCWPLVIASGPVVGELGMAGNPVKLSGVDDPATRRPAPALDADRARILAELGLA